MKNLFSVLLITTLAVASSLAAPETAQGGVQDPVTNEDDALWEKKHHHHKEMQCPKPKPVFIAVPIPIAECEHECKSKCEFGEKECGEACESGENDCKDKCEDHNGECKGKCEDHKGKCKDKCKDAEGPCNYNCDRLAVDVCIRNGGAADWCKQALSCQYRCEAAFPGAHDACGEVCASSDCKGTCIKLRVSQLLSSTDDDACEKLCGECYERCLSIFGDQPTNCANVCEISDDCRGTCAKTEKTCEDACEDCDKDCDEACHEREEACGKACESGKDGCKGKCEYGEHECEERCKPCDAECEKVCLKDEEDCFFDCKAKGGLDCSAKCGRDCGFLCERSCKHCLFQAAAVAPEAVVADSTVSEQVESAAATPAAQ
ncbi:hypothetical protein MVEG_01399 [Podila verticillata NRRL 6337]|nr:hypothetical protein MVEG_01399 [Podila verticillata NRRL 6337]